MKVCIIFALLVFAANPSAKPNRDGKAAHGATKQESEPSVVVVNNQTATTQAKHGDNKGPRWDAAIWANWALVVVGIVTFLAIYYQARKTAEATVVMRDQVKIAKDALIASERPKLQIKDISFAIQSLDDREWKIGCIVANVGGTKATIIESVLTISRPVIGTVGSLLVGRPHYDRKYSFDPFSIEPGERKDKTVTMDVNDRLRFKLAHEAAETRRSEGKEPLTTSPIICFGYFRYRDERDIARLTGFGWLWNSLDMTFARLDHPNYEYQD